MKIIDDQPPVDPKMEALAKELKALAYEATKAVRFRVFHFKRGWEKAHESEHNRMRNWLREVINLRARVNEIEIRHTPEVWERYKRFGITGLTEQVELNKRQQELEVFLNKNKPQYIVKSKPSRTATVTYVEDLNPSDFGI